MHFAIKCDEISLCSDIVDNNANMTFEMTNMRMNSNIVNMGGKRNVYQTISNGNFAIGHRSSISIMNGKTFKIEAVVNCPQVTAISQLSKDILYITSNSVGLFFFDMFHLDFYFFFKYSDQKYKGWWYTVNDIKSKNKTTFYWMEQRVTSR